MGCDYLRCLHSFLKIEVDLCFKFDLREILDIRNFLKETTDALKLRFDYNYLIVKCSRLRWIWLINIIDNICKITYWIDGCECIK